MPQIFRSCLIQGLCSLTKAGHCFTVYCDTGQSATCRTSSSFGVANAFMSHAIVSILKALHQMHVSGSWLMLNCFLRQYWKPSLVTALSVWLVNLDDAMHQLSCHLACTQNWLYHKYSLCQSGVVSPCSFTSFLAIVGMNPMCTNINFVFATISTSPLSFHHPHSTN